MYAYVSVHDSVVKEP